MHTRRYAIGAEVTEADGVHFRVWAPKCQNVEVVLEDGTVQSAGKSLKAEADGYFSGAIAEARAGMNYRLRLDRDDQLYPDPMSRFQPDGPHGPSQIVDPSSFRWTDQAWRGIAKNERVLYEMHLGTFTPEGTWQAAEKVLPDLARMGITLLEVMPVAEFPGRFGWGYDGVNLFAPTRLYGGPDDFRHFVDAAHSLKLGVILDVVYNHLGPDGNYLRPFADDYFTKKYENEWGDALNFDGPNSGPVREFFKANAAYWIDEYHLDGLRLDATQQIFDESEPHILAEINDRARAAAKNRAIFLVAENERQEARMARPRDAGGHGLDVLWNDDFHHSAAVALTGRNDAYYSDHLGRPQEFVSAAKWGFLFQGQRYSWQEARRGHASLDLAPDNFVCFSENHDQVANSCHGSRLHLQTSPGRWRAMTALLLLGPATPMLFQGQEYGSTQPFFYFADHKQDLAKLVSKGRKEFMSQFEGMVQFGLTEQVPTPDDLETFLKCKLNPAQRNDHPEIAALHHDLLKLRREDPAFRAPVRRGVDGAILGPNAFVLRDSVEGGNDRLLAVNFGVNLRLREAPEPLLAPPESRHWKILWSSEAGRYGGAGHALLDNDDNWHLPGEAAVVLAAEVGVPPSGGAA